MNNNKIYKTYKININSIINTIFILSSLLSLYGNKLIKESIYYNDLSRKERADKIFIKITFISILIYIYFLKENYNELKKKNEEKYKIRVLGSTLILIGTILIFYFQINSSFDNPTDI